MIRCADGHYYEGKGVPPNKEAAQDWVEFFDSSTPTDNVLEAAIAHLRAVQ
jgi:hypothetical protein